MLSLSPFVAVPLARPSRRSIENVTQPRFGAKKVADTTLQFHSPLKDIEGRVPAEVHQLEPSDKNGFAALLTSWLNQENKMKPEGRISKANHQSVKKYSSDYQQALAAPQFPKAKVSDFYVLTVAEEEQENVESGGALDSAHHILGYAHLNPEPEYQDLKTGEKKVEEASSPLLLMMLEYLQTAPLLREKGSVLGGFSNLLSPFVGSMLNHQVTLRENVLSAQLREESPLLGALLGRRLNLGEPVVPVLGFKPSNPKLVEHYEKTILKSLPLSAYQKALDPDNSEVTVFNVNPEGVQFFIDRAKEESAKPTNPTVTDHVRQMVEKMAK